MQIISITEVEHARIIAMAGKKVWKKKPSSAKQPKPFKSGLKINTVKGVTIHPQTRTLGFVFEEDDSIVECSRCWVVPLTLTSVDFASRPALPGQEEKKASRLRALWEAEEDITFAIAIDDLTADSDRVRDARVRRDSAIADLLVITKDAQ